MPNPKHKKRLAPDSAAPESGATEKPITFEELKGLGIWKAMRGRKYVAMITETKTGKFLACAGELAWKSEPCLTLEEAQAGLMEYLGENE